MTTTLREYLLEIGHLPKAKHTVNYLAKFFLVGIFNAAPVLFTFLDNLVRLL